MAFYIRKAYVRLPETNLTILKPFATEYIEENIRRSEKTSRKTKLANEEDKVALRSNPKIINAK